MAGGGGEFETSGGVGIIRTEGIKGMGWGSEDLQSAVDDAKAD